MEQELIELRKRNKQLEMENDILKQHIFRESRNNYGTRKIKKELDKLEWQVSRRRIGRIMKQEGLISNYTVAQYKPHVDKCNESQIANVVNRQFKNQPEYNVVVNDLTYVRVGMSWNYMCVLVDLFNRKIIGYSARRNKDAILVSKAFSKVKVNLNHIKILHTDLGYQTPAEYQKNHLKKLSNKVLTIHTAKNIIM